MPPSSVVLLLFGTNYQPKAQPLFGPPPNPVFFVVSPDHGIVAGNLPDHDQAERIAEKFAIDNSTQAFVTEAVGHFSANQPTATFTDLSDLSAPTPILPVNGLGDIGHVAIRLAHQIGRGLPYS